MEINRRKFLYQAGLAGLVSAASWPVSASEKQIVQPVNSNEPQILPTPQQKAWMDLQFGMFIHFGINTYYDKEWSDGTLDPKAFNPEQLDTDQW